jgi:hypothetical protein
LLSFVSGLAGLRWVRSGTRGADLKVVQDQFGHSTVVLTADTYTSY